MLRKILIPCVLLIMLISPSQAVAKTTDKPKVLFVVTNSVELKELKEAKLPIFQKLSRKHKLSIGLMNVRPGKAAFTQTSGYLTIGAGAKADAGSYGTRAFNATERFTYQDKEYLASHWYRQATGFRLQNHQIVNLGIVDASRLSDKYDYPLIPGLLGGLLGKKGIKTAVIGNADDIDGYHREASMIAMDTTGKVDFGNVKTKFNYSNSYEKLAVETKKYLKKADFVVVELGKTARLDYRRNFMTDSKYQSSKEAALNEINTYLQSIIGQMDLNKDLILMASPTPSTRSLNNKNLLSPLIVVRNNARPLIYSESTRWPGIADNTDIAPTILKVFGVAQPAEMTGNTITSTDSKDTEAINDLLIQEETAVANNLARAPLLTGYVVIIMSVIILAVLLLFLPAVKQGTYKVVQTLLVFLVSVPPVLLLFSLVHYADPWVPIAGVIIGSMALTALFLLIVRDRHKAFLFLFIGTVALVVIDVFTGSYLMKNSVLGFSPIVGARFYGIGNEFMGITIGATILSLSLFKDIYKTKWGNSVLMTILVFITITAVVGLPGLGTNVGGALAASTGFVFAVFYLSGRPFTWRQPVILLTCLAVALAIIFLSDSLLGANTHAAKTTELISKGGFAEILTIFKRKILANFKLVKYTAWTKVIITILIIMPILFMKPSGAVKRLKEKLPNVWAGVIGVSFGAIAAFLFNDSGIVAAATCLLYAAVVVLYVIMDQQLEKA